MKILQIANGDFFSTYGGGQVYVKNVVDEMIRQNLDITVISFTRHCGLDPQSPFQKQNYKGIDLYEIYPKDENIIKLLIRQINPDIIHIHAEKAMLSKIGKELNIPTVITAHHGGIVCPAGTLMNYKDEICKIPVNHQNCMRCVLRNTRFGEFFYPLLKILPLSFRLKIGNRLSQLPFIYFVTPVLNTNLYIENKRKEWNAIVENTGKMIAPSYAIAENMVLNGLPQKKIEIVPHGIPALPGRHCGESRNPLNNVEIVGLKFFYVGRIAYIKGIHLLLKAFVKSAEDSRLRGNDTELHLIGNIQGEYAQKLQKKYKNHPRIIFHGKIQPDEVSKLIESFDILVHPAICLEIFGLDISEALLQGKPVIATRCGGAEMQIEDKKNGLLIEPNQIEALKIAMRWMIDHPDERRKMAENAPQKVILMDEHIKNIVYLYEKLQCKNV
ncbi:hypothetical protein FACS189413_08820 [Bacteroidia bacterium]|nr:hypothetical protein FACS189413_08820 [Bacteroidia bacterium]